MVGADCSRQLAVPPWDNSRIPRRHEVGREHATNTPASTGNPARAAEDVPGVSIIGAQRIGGIGKSLSGARSMTPLRTALSSGLTPTTEHARRSMPYSGLARPRKHSASNNTKPNGLARGAVWAPSLDTPGAIATDLAPELIP